MIRLSNDQKRYIISGEEYARVTDVCNVLRKPGLENWKARVGEEEARRIGNETSEYGELVHKVTALNDEGKMKDVEVMLKKYEWLVPHWVAWFDWVGEWVKQIIIIEKVVWSVKMKCAGKVDRVVIMKGDRDLSILDIKTGSLYDEIGMQLHGYKMIYNEGNGKKVKRTMAVQLPRLNPGVVKVKEYDNKKYTHGFKAALELYRSMR